MQDIVSAGAPRRRKPVFLALDRTTRFLPPEFSPAFDPVRRPPRRHGCRTRQLLPPISHAKQRTAKLSRARRILPPPKSIPKAPPASPSLHKSPIPHSVYGSLIQFTSSQIHPQSASTRKKSALEIQSGLRGISQLAVLQLPSIHSSVLLMLGGTGSRRGDGDGKAAAAGEAGFGGDRWREPVVVIKAGDERPTFLATPASGCGVDGDDVGCGGGGSDEGRCVECEAISRPGGDEPMRRSEQGGVL